MISRLSGLQFLAVAEQRAQHLVGAFLAQRVEPQLRVVGLVSPLMRVLGSIVYQQQNLRSPDRVGEQIEQSLGALVDPMEVLEDHDQRLVERFAQENPLDRVERAPLASLHLDLRDLTVLVAQAEQSVQVRECILERAIESEDLAVNLLAPRALVVLGADLEIAPEQIDHR